MKVSIFVPGPVGNLWELPQLSMSDAIIEAHQWEREGKKARIAVMYEAHELAEMGATVGMAVRNRLYEVEA